MTLFGAAVTPYPETNRTHTQEVLQHEIEVGPMQILRTYDGGMPMRWADSSSATGAQSPRLSGWTRRASWHSVKPDLNKLAFGQLDGWVRDYIESIPVTGFPRLLTVWHEPVAKVRKGVIDDALWRLGNKRFGRVVRDLGHPDVLFGPCFAGKWDLTGDFTLDDFGLDEEDFELWDFIGWDPYHEGSKSGDYTIPLTDYLDPLVEWTKRTGVQMAIGETGFVPNMNAPYLRANYLQDLADYAREHNFLAVCYFDASVSSYHWYLRTTQDGSVDEISAKTWGLNYRS